MPALGRIRSARNGSALLGLVLALVLFGLVTLVLYGAMQRWPNATFIVVGLLSTVLGVSTVLRRRRLKKNWQRPLLRDIWIALIKHLPPHWTAADLVLVPEGQASRNGEDGAPVITSPEGHPETVRPSEDLLDAARRLEAESERRNDRWQRVIIHVRKENKGWQSGADFDYGPTAADRA